MKREILENYSMENFIGLLKQEMYDNNTCLTSDDLAAINDYLYDDIYKRKKLKLAGMNPV